MVTAVVILIAVIVAMGVVVCLLGGGPYLAAAVPRLAERVLPERFDALMQRAGIYGRFDSGRLLEIARDEDGPIAGTAVAALVHDVSIAMGMVASATDGRMRYRRVLTKAFPFPFRRLSRR